MRFYVNSKTKDGGERVKRHLSTIGEVVSSPEECDLIVSVGGDGTLLNSGKLAIQLDKPVVGINAGHLGYLCAYKIDELESLTLNDFKCLKQTSRTTIEYDGHIAINDICVLKANPVQSIEASVEGVASWKGDGVIVSTPTGSSSYNQSAGGPILDPISSELVVTPVCPHFASKGYQILNDDEVRIDVSDRTPSLLTVDDKVIGPVQGRITIRKSKKSLKLLTK